MFNKGWQSKPKVTYRYTLIRFYSGSRDEGIPIERRIVVTGQICSDYGSSICCMAGCNYGSNGGRILIMVAMVAMY
jgi:hypothetical protein